MDKSDAINRWAGIFSALGVDVGDGRHTACPICQKNNFRFDDLDGTGTYICTCGAGDGWALIQAVFNCDFKEAIRQVEPLISAVLPTRECREKTVTPEFLREIFTGSKPATEDCPVGMYLRKRGLTNIPTVLRYHPSCWESETKMKQPTMLGVFALQNGSAVTMHRTYLTADGYKMKIDSPKKILPGLKKMTGGSIRLYSPSENGVIGIAEGIETAIACQNMHGIPTWAATTAGLLESFDPPTGIKKVYIFGDNDSHKSFAGEAAAYRLAKRLIEVRKMSVEVLIPGQPGDWLDELNRRNS